MQYLRYHKPFLLTISFLMLSFSMGYTQSIKRQVISSIGSSGAFSSVVIGQTVGQSYNTGVSNAGTTVTQGFQQPVAYSLEEVFKPEITNLDVSVFPNPASHSITISSKEEIKKSIISVSDLQGKLLMRSTVNNLQSHKLDCDQWQPGIYFITVFDTQSKSKTLKLTISK